MTFIRRAHNAGVHQRRVRVLAGHLSEMIPQNVSVLDVGSGDGLLASLIIAQRPDLQWNAVDTLPRPQAHIPIQMFDGKHLPFSDKSIDFVLFVDVLHHTDDAMAILREAARVARRGLIVKDHVKTGLFAGVTLRFMDWVGNAGWGVSLPYNYWDQEQWNHAESQFHLRTAEKRVELGLYPPWGNWLFGRGLHFIARYTIEPSLQP